MATWPLFDEYRCGMAPLIASIFNDVIGPVMRGPSSSHSAASVRIGLLLHDLMEGRPDGVNVTFDKFGSLATTHESQGTDMGLFAGLLGWQADDERLPGAPETLRRSGTDVSVELAELHDTHPNTYRIKVWNTEREHSVVALSTGGGIIELIEIDGRSVRLFGDSHLTMLYLESQDVHLADEAFGEIAHSVDRHDRLIVLKSAVPMDRSALKTLNALEGVTDIRQLRPVLPVQSAPDTAVPFSNASELDLGAEGGQRLDTFAIAYEQARGGLTEAEVFEQAQRILNVMRASVEAGLSGTEYDDRILGHQSGRLGQMRRDGTLLGSDLLNRMIEYVTALMEAKSAMQVIVAAPTAGACATFPGALLATADDLQLSDEAVCRGLLAGGLVGVFVTNRSSFAAEVGGCQAETGAGAAMAAAALVTMSGGSADQALSAASQALQNVLGLICDPVANRVEAPCLGRNVSGAANALTCANMALAGYDHLIPLDEVLDAHRQVSELMARELRCTGLGGLAVTPTAQRIELDLKRHRR